MPATTGINNSGQIAGVSYGGPDGVFWQGGNVYLLSDMITDGAPVQEVLSMDSHAEIITHWYDFDTQAFRPVLLLPTP